MSPQQRQRKDRSFMPDSQSYGTKKVCRRLPVNASTHFSIRSFLFRMLSHHLVNSSSNSLDMEGSEGRGASAFTILPSRSNKMKRGIPVIMNLSMKSSLGPIKSWMPFMSPSFTIFSQAALLLSHDRLTKAMSFPAYASSSFFRWGSSPRQGPHHVAHTSIYTYLPFKSANETDFPLISGQVKVGEGSRLDCFPLGAGLVETFGQSRILHILMVEINQCFSPVNTGP